MNKKFMYQMALIFSGVLLVIIIFAAAIFNLVKEKREQIEVKKIEQTEQADSILGEEEIYLESITASESIDVPNFGTFITNMDRYAVPLLEDNSFLLEKSLSDFLPNLQTAEIFYVTIPDAEQDKICFFVKIPEEEQIVVLTYSREKQEAEASWSEYTEDEILSEVWNGNQPECRDEEE